MAENTAIEWADHTFNPWIGCTKVSPACSIKPISINPADAQFIETRRLQIAGMPMSYDWFVAARVCGSSKVAPQSTERATRSVKSRPLQAT